MFLARGSSAVSSIILGILFLLWPAASVVAYDGSCDWNDINEPIGLDLGYQYM
jgi:hypothetical protein